MNVAIYLLSLIFLLGGHVSKIPLPSFKQNIDKKEATIGDVLHFKVDVFTSPASEVIPPENQPNFGQLIVKDRIIKTISKKHIKHTILDYEIVSYDVGKDTIPALSIAIKTKAKTEKLETLPVYIEIKSVAPSLTGKEDIKALKPQAGIRISYLYYLSILFALAAIVTAVLFLLKKYRKGEFKKTAEATPPWDIALSKLEKLEMLTPKTTEQIKHFYTELSLLFREYLELLLKFPALESTTSEIVNHLKRRKEYSPYFPKMKDFLNRSDLVKFAKYIPPQFNNKEETKIIKDIVLGTKPAEESKEND